MELKSAPVLLYTAKICDRCDFKNVLYDGQWSRTKDNHRSLMPSRKNQEDK